MSATEGSSSFGATFSTDKGASLSAIAFSSLVKLIPYLAEIVNKNMKKLSSYIIGVLKS